MITPQGPHLGRMLRYVGLPLAALLTWDVAIVVAYKLLHWEWVGSRHIPLALYGGAIGVIVGFRNNSAYARWWEARTLWGHIVNNSRSFARQVTSLLHAMRPKDEIPVRAMQEKLIYHQIAFVHALRQQLRGLPSRQQLAPLLSAPEISSLEHQQNIPLALQQAMGTMLREAKDAGWIDGPQWQSMDRCLDDLGDAQGGTERISNTPMPKQYDYFPMLFVHIYCLLLPIGMVENLGWFTPLGSTLVGFMFLALDKIGRDLEDPFSNTIYDLPLTSIATTIEINLRQMLGERDLPPPVKPLGGVLW